MEYKFTIYQFYDVFTSTCVNIIKLSAPTVDDKCGVPKRIIFIRNYAINTLYNFFFRKDNTYVYR